MVLVDALGRVNLTPGKNPALREHVLTDVDPIQETHLSEPGLLVLDAAGLDDNTVYAFQNAIAQTWAATVDRTTRDAGQPGARLRMYVDLRQVLTQRFSEGALTGGLHEAWSATTGEWRTRFEVHGATPAAEVCGLRVKSGQDSVASFGQCATERRQGANEGCLGAGLVPDCEVVALQLAGQGRATGARIGLLDVVRWPAMTRSCMYATSERAWRSGMPTTP
ncbi:hypothetical protein FHS35_009255 [Streptomyces umbrinus]|uniref:DUF6207 family protein n=1 Tax=Streptomyces TaxID=1883 RepID=UPI0019AE84DF|nr:DUF6207 family protein [Streptomyces umbrinus]MCR3732337.1 hypothetical protein [Streptomyces umbrinus]MCX4564248.1 DUF6207 family protein [Streptomyces phaeochromogenes]GHH68196.1 hypothetical protein GCM10018775_92600 [Streptomyces umbrinus]